MNSTHITMGISRLESLKSLRTLRPRVTVDYEDCDWYTYGGTIKNRENFHTNYELNINYFIG